MAIETAVLEMYLRSIARLVDGKRYSQYVIRKKIFSSTCVVVDLSYKNFNFAFDFTPTDEKLVTIDLVQRLSLSSFSLQNLDSNGKRRLATTVSLDKAFSIFEKKIWDIIKKLNLDIPLPKKTSFSSNYMEVGLPNRRKTVGVLTLPLNENIGGNLQAYALMEAIRSIGHDPVLINRRPAANAGNDVNTNVELISNSISMSKEIPNRSFIETYITPITKAFTSSSDLRDSLPELKFDAVVTGSDQIWRPKYSRSMLMEFFLQFLPDADSTTKRISYAASFGAPNWEFDDVQTKNARKLLKKFDAVSVREDSAVGLCQKNLGVKAEHVLDPTLLLSAEHYRTKFSLNQLDAKKSSILAYILDKSQDKLKLISDVSKKFSLKTFNTKSQELSSDGIPIGSEEDATVECWLSSFHAASYVITDSFHGVVFSIIFNKPFIAYGNPSRGLARFTSLLKGLGLQNRLVINSDEHSLDKLLAPIDWPSVNAKLSSLRVKSIGFLESVLTDQPKVEFPPLNRENEIGSSISGYARQATDHALISQQDSPVCRPLNVLCTGCGVCVSESKGTLSMQWNTDGFLVPVENSSKKAPLESLKVCPFNPHPEKGVSDEDKLSKIFLGKATNFDPRAGSFEKSYIGYSKQFRASSSSGGIATYVFNQLLANRHVDYIFVVQTDSQMGYKYQIFNKDDDIKKTSKTRYTPVSMDELFSIIEKKPGKVAVSGVACFIKAIRLKQYYYPELKERIPFLVGIICGGLKSRHYTDYLAQNSGISGQFKEANYRVKDPKRPANDYSFSAKDSNSKVHEVRMSRLGDMWGTGLFKARACDFCTDVLTELADISLGDAWLPEYKADGLGNSVIITRTALADRIIQEGMKSNMLVLDNVPIARVAQSQGGGFRHKRNSIKFRLWMSKKFSNTPVPTIRARVQNSIPVTEALIQIRRERARSKSLTSWWKEPEIKAFNRKMQPVLDELKSATATSKENKNDSLPVDLPISRWLMRKISTNQVTYDEVRHVVKINRSKVIK